MKEDQTPSIEDILPGYKPEYENTSSDVHISDTLGITEEDYEMITDIADIFFIGEATLTSCVKKTLEMVQNVKNMTSKNHGLAVLVICMQVRERYNMILAVQEKGPDMLSRYQSSTLVKSMSLAFKLGIGKYFMEALQKRLVIDHPKREKKRDVMSEAEEAIRRLLDNKDQ